MTKKLQKTYTNYRIYKAMTKKLQRSYKEIDKNTIRSAMLSHNQDVGSSTENRDVSTHYTVKKRVHWMLAWKPKSGKNHGSPQTAKYHYVRIYNGGAKRQRPLAPSLRYQAVTAEATTSSSLTLSSLYTLLCSKLS